MKITLAGVFAGVFIGAFAYELLQRSRPDVVSSIRETVSETMDKYIKRIENEEEVVERKTTE
ncbi:MAG: hypothetical protein OEY01_10525 [Desulfobulbaceae bacterium]|nr:hypothetical protein [Desulfobulbaceae bacterium]HIJ79383.1 hypothetical protein [Deltaproteobacteria bacterium]